MSRKPVQKVNLDRLIGEDIWVTCIDDFTVERSLTLGEKYKVLEMSSEDPEEFGWVKIKCDTNRIKLFSKGFFSKNY